ncbi:MAG TPA: MFS transporter [Patescibacteria group bacterium]|nr:MFS transporter [Patescibacteria group bacterium]
MTDETGTTSRWLSGMRGFTVVWIGQFISLLGTGMTGFVLTIWAWQVTGEATALALVGLFTFAPTVLMSPFAGALVDRWNRKKVMMLSDLASGLSTVVVLILMASGRLEVWHLYVTGAFSGVFQAFQFPAYSAAVSMMLPKEQYARANGMIGLAGAVSNIIAPVASGILLGVVGITGIMAFDVFTFIVAIVALLPVHIPQPPSAGAGQSDRPSLLSDSVYGFRYIYERPSLLGLQLVFFSINLIMSLVFPLMAPMILSRTGNDTVILGGVQSAFGVGGLLGGVLMSVWGGPKRRVHGVLLGMASSSLLGTLLMGLGRGPLAWAFAAFATMCFMPIINGSNQAIWQSKVPPEVQGRVFATRMVIAQIAVPISMALAGPLADWVFGPAMMPGGALAPVFGWLVGTGPGTGISLIFVFVGLAGVVVGLSGYAFNSVRNAEDIIPDHDASEQIS